MSCNDNQLKTISASVCEQLGIEEEDFIDNELKSIEYLSERITSLEKAIDEKDSYIHKLEVLLVAESKRIDLLEQICYEFKKSFKR